MSHPCAEAYTKLIGRRRRALRTDTEKTTRLEYDVESNAMTEFGTALDLYFGGDMEASIALSGQVCGRIDAVRPVAGIIAEVREQFFREIGRLADQYPAAGQSA